MKEILYGSVCSGVEAATVAWHSLGWKPAWFCEFDKFPSAVLKHHYPHVPNLGDMTIIEKRKEYQDHAINLLVGGTPCQSFSIAGLRKGLADDRGNLALKFCEILRDKQPRWFIWENVPGVLSSNGGRDFAAILSGFRECGYGVAYRVLDAQYFGVAQRRRRVFVVGYIGDWRPAAAVLFERESLRGNNPPRRAKREEVAPTLDVRAGRSGENTFATSGGLIPEIAGTLTARPCRSQGAQDADGDHILPVAHTLRGEGFDASEDGTGRQNLICIQTGTEIAPTLTAPIQEKTLGKNGKRQDGGRSDKIPAICSVALRGREGGATAELGGDLANAVRRLTPRECERLQGFPDDYTLIPSGKKQAADGPRYKAMGNSMAVPVMRWIGERIALFESLDDAVTRP